MKEDSKSVLKQAAANAEKLRTIEKMLTSQAGKARDSVFRRFPFVFIGLSTFGLVATL